MNSSKNMFENRHVANDSLDKFFLELSYKKNIYFINRRPFDNLCLDTRGDKWSATEYGVVISFDFNNVLNNGILNPAYKNLAKWSVAQFASSYSLKYAKLFYYSFIEFMECLPQDNITLKNCCTYLEEVSKGNKGSSTEYYAFKRFVIMLIEIDAPGFTPEDLFLLEKLPFPITNNFDAYYDIELKLKPYECAFIQQGLSHDFFDRNILSYSDLLETIIVSICYEIALRPCQLHVLHDDDFISINNKYYSITRPHVKSTHVARSKGTDRIQISKETGALIQILQKSREGLGQLLRNRDNSHTSGGDYNDFINEALHRWGASPNVKFNTYDFRHNVGHTLAMQGSSAEEIAFILGHNNTVVARHYISATPEIAKRKQLALGGNQFYQQMIGMIMTGEIVKEEDWDGKQVLGEVGSHICTGIGGCAADSCKYHPIHSCYSCKDYNPFLDGHHQQVLDALREQINEVMTLSDSTGQIKENPAISILEGTIGQVKAVISRCEIDKVTKT